MPRFALDWRGGVNQLIDPQSINDNQLVESKNAFPSLDGILDKREPVRNVAVLPVNSFVFRPITMFVPDPVLGLDFVIHGTPGSGVYEFLTCVKLDQLAAPLATDTITFNVGLKGLIGPAKFVNYKGRVIAVAGGVEGFFQLNKKPTGDLYWTKISFAWPSTFTGVVAGQSQVEAVQPRVLGVYRGRLVFANFGAGKGNWLVFADRDTQTNWNNVDDAPTWAIVGNDVLASNGRHLEISNLHGEEILSVKEISLQAVGSPLTTAMLIRSQNYAVISTGEPAQTIDSEFSTAAGYIGSFQANKVNFNVGAAGLNAECDTKYGLCWASQDDVWLMNGSTPMRVGTLIQPVLRECPPSLRKFHSMAYANGIVFLAVCTQSSADEYNLRIQHWRLDLRNGPPQTEADAKWYGPQDYESLPGLAGIASIADGPMCASIVTSRIYGKETICGAIQCSSNTSQRTAIISFNEGSSGDDVPFPDVRTGRVWDANDNAGGIVVPVGDIVRPTIYKANGFLYVCTVSGVPGAVEPTWPITSGGTVVDGGVTWAEIRTATVWTRLISYYGTTQLSYLMDVLFKDFNFGQAARDKVVRRADIVAYYGSKALVSLRTIINQGGLAKMLGPTPIGGDGAADNDTGLAVLDSSGLSEEYEARSLRPSTLTGRTAADALAAWDSTDSGGIIRGKSIQPRFTDDDGIVIDTTNDQLAFATYLTAKPTTIRAVANAALTNGRYANVNALLAEIAVRMNTAMASFTQGSEFNWNASPWNYDDAYSAAIYPYLNTLTFAFTVRRTSGPNPFAMAFLFGVTDAATSLLGTTVYPKRTKRLLALLGYDTTERYRTVSGMSTLFDDGSQVQLVGEQESPILTSPTRLCATSCIPYTRSPVVSLSDIELDYYVKPGLPFSKVSR